MFFEKNIESINEKYAFSLDGVFVQQRLKNLETNIFLSYCTKIKKNVVIRNSHEKLSIFTFPDSNFFCLRFE